MAVAHPELRIDHTNRIVYRGDAPISGKVSYAVLSFGGFLGMGQKHLPIPWARLTYDRTLGAYQLDLSEEELKQAPSFAADQEFDWGDRSREIEIHNYYRVPPYWGAY